MFSLSKQSIETMQGVKQKLIDIVTLAISISEIDFKVQEGLRSIERQKQLLAAGKSKTLNSKHITGDAVDLVAIVDGKLSWDWKYYYSIAEAMKQAAIQLNTQIVWGGVWDKVLNELEDTRIESDQYAHRIAALGRKPFLDGPHFQLKE